MIDLTAVGKKIASLRNEASLSQDQLAERLFLSRQAISNWEVGKSAPSIDNVIELSKLFHVPFETILCLDETPSIDPENPFLAHERLYVLREVISGRAKVNMSVLLRDATLDERNQIVHAIAQRKIHDDWRSHKNDFTYEEISCLTKGGKR
jgi:transcriptional regulator with XRE-family HTH domain